MKKIECAKQAFFDRKRDLSYKYFLVITIETIDVKLPECCKMLKKMIK